MSALAVIGFVVITVVCFYAIAAVSMMALMCFLGFDEVSIPGGILFASLAVLIGAVWWVTLGERIDISIGVS